MTGQSIRPLLATALLAAAVLGSGCVAFNVGKPETFTHAERVVETAELPIQTEVLSSDARLQKRGNDVAVGLGLEILEGFEKREHTETVIVRKQKRLAIGFFPGAAECIFMPNGALEPAWSTQYGGYVETPKWHTVYSNDPRPGFGTYVFWQLGSLLSFGVIHGFATLNSLLVQPFADWHCEHDFIGPDILGASTPSSQRYYDASLSPKLQSLDKFAPPERKKIGVYTCFDKRAGAGSSKPISHLGLVGVHKYLAVFVDDLKRTPSTVIGTETKRRSAFAIGPFIAEFKIPDLNHDDWKRVAPGETQATFALPAVQRDCTVEAVVSLREDPAANGRAADDLTRQALAKTAGREWRFDLALKGTGRPASGPVSVPAPQPAAPLFEVREITPKGDGQYFVRVAIKDKSKTFSVIHLVEPEVYRLVRNDFRSKNPGEPAQFVREYMRPQTERDGEFLTFTGWVFSVRPAEDGWHYDAASRTGWIRLRVTGGIPASEAEAWAHENIPEIVKYKNAVLEPGKAPPPGAAFRSLGEKFEDGILTIEFEAVQ